MVQPVIIDTNFIMACLKQKIDFFEYLRFEGFHPIVPTSVINELKKISNSKQKKHNKQLALLALKQLDTEKPDYLDLTINGKYLDKEIYEYVKKNKNCIVATLDAELKKRLRKEFHTPILVIKNKKNLHIH